MNAHAQFLRDWSATLRAELSALEDQKQFVDPNYFPDTLRAPTSLQKNISQLLAHLNRLLPKTFRLWRPPQRIFAPKLTEFFCKPVHY
jgi:hypothetical protein